MYVILASYVMLTYFLYQFRYLSAIGGPAGQLLEQNTQIIGQKPTLLPARYVSSQLMRINIKRLPFETIITH